MILTNHLKILKFHLFADGTSIFYSQKDLRNVEMTLNNELIKVFECMAHRQQINIECF